MDRPNNHPTNNRVVGTRGWKDRLVDKFYVGNIARDVTEGKTNIKILCADRVPDMQYHGKCLKWHMPI